MRPFNPNDQIAAQQIECIQRKRIELISSARQKEENHEVVDAICLYTEAQHHSLYAGEGLKVRIVNENVDFDNWHHLEKVIKKLNRKNT